MTKYSKSVLLTLFLSFSAGANNNLICPATVQAGTPLSISYIVKNDDCANTLNIQNTVVSLAGNPGGFSVGGIGLIGPFVAPYNATVPTASCVQLPICYTYFNGIQNVTDCYPGPTNVTDSTLTIPNVQVVNLVPKGMAGTMIAVSAGILDDKNVLKVAGVCNITVTK